MDADGGGTAPAPASHGHAGVSNRASTALAAVSVFLILLCLFWRFIWQCLKHERRGGPSSAAATATSSSSSASTPPPSCPSRDGAAAYVAGEAARRTPRATTKATSSPLPVFVRVAAAGFGAEKVDCAVCLAELGDGEAATRLVPGCGHGFHAECIEAWFRVNSTCPLCRAAVAAAASGQSAGEAPQYCSSVW
ncbi:hypothetical protein SEVIR_9G415000v4 [Setaria viridis]|uniref:RING-type E3 ubiquitin transferase n=3 Tax=Setaria TaxID=4554 RepID=A0A368SR16_SETIT|nr:E3 ubiquitin-protein ligase EL5 [Setaria italica]RCV44887.1 hypothetical protein SETIT_9G410900v2 [Setaria italica]TKV96210.1 hypothetical protein SEVIR_9G415000v2 [Setaria viridis]